MSAPSSTLTPEAAAAQLVFQLSLSYVVSSALHVALELGLPDRLAAGPRTVSDLARDTGANEDALFRILRVLASVGMFEEQSPRTFAANLPAQMLRTGPNSSRDIAYFMTDPYHFRVYAEMMHSVKTGQPAADKVDGQAGVRGTSREQPELSAVFNDAMTPFSAQVVAGGARRRTTSAASTCWSTSRADTARC